MLVHQGTRLWVWQVRREEGRGKRGEERGKTGEGRGWREKGKGRRKARESTPQEKQRELKRFDDAGS